MQRHIIQQIIDATPVGRLGQPADITPALAFLVREDADFITGATLNVNGSGYMA